MQIRTCICLPTHDVMGTVGISLLAINRQHTSPGAIFKFCRNNRRCDNLKLWNRYNFRYQLEYTNSIFTIPRRQFPHINHIRKRNDIPAVKRRPAEDRWEFSSTSETGNYIQKPADEQAPYIKNGTNFRWGRICRESATTASESTRAACWGSTLSLQ